MKQTRFTTISILSMVFILALFLSGCHDQDKDNDVLDEPEITVEYLSGEYAEQILRDGGEETLGMIALEKAPDGNFSITVNSMVIVESSITDEGYYVADKNISSTVPLETEAYVTYIRSPDKGPEVLAMNEFANLVQRDSQELKTGGVQPGEEKLYQVYIIGGRAVMILAKELPRT